jgi:hypothetical protein
MLNRNYTTREHARNLSSSMRPGRRRSTPEVVALEDRALLSVVVGRELHTARVATVDVRIAEGTGGHTVEGMAGHRSRSTRGTHVTFPGGFVNSHPGGTKVKFPGGFVISTPGSTHVTFPGGFVNTGPGGTSIKFPGGSINIG